MRSASGVGQSRRRAVILCVALTILVGVLIVLLNAWGAAPPAVQPEDLLLLTPMALERVTEAAERGDVVAQATAGDAYLRGERVTKNVTAAVIWFEKVAAHDPEEVRELLSRMRSISNERRRTTDAREVRRLEHDYLDLVVEKLAHEQAMIALIHIYSGGEGSSHTNPRRAVGAMIKGTQSELPAAQRALGVASIFGFPGVPRDTELGLYLLRKAAMQRDHGSEYVLGELYLSGVVVPKNLAAAAFWYSRAAPYLPQAADRKRYLELQRRSADYFWE